MDLVVGTWVQGTRMKIRLRVKEICFSERGAYVSFDEPYQDSPDSLDCNVKVIIPEAETQEWILLIGKEVLFERVSPVHGPRAVPLQDPRRTKRSP